MCYATWFAYKNTRVRRIKSYSVTFKEQCHIFANTILKKPVGERTCTNFRNNFSFFISVVKATAQRAFAPLVHSRDLRKNSFGPHSSPRIERKNEILRGGGFFYEKLKSKTRYIVSSSRF